MFCTFCTTTAAVHPATAQSSVDDVQIPLRQAPVTAAKAEYSPNPAQALLIPKTVDLVLVPVSVTDGMQRLVTGLDRANFEVFEGKKSVAIRRFSSEDAPVSVGILVDTSASTGGQNRSCPGGCEPVLPVVQLRRRILHDHVLR